jgi:hypothetical protein
VTAVTDGFLESIAARYGLSLPSIRFRRGGAPSGTILILLRGVPAVVQPAGDDPVAAIRQGLELAENVLDEVVDHALVARALAETKVAFPSDPTFLTAATVVARGFVQERVALAPVAEWAAAMVAVWSSRPRSTLELIDGVRAAPAIRGRLPANRPGVVRVDFDPEISAALLEQCAGNAADLPTTAVQPALIWIANAVAASGGPAAVVVDPRLRYLLARTLAMSGTPIALSSPAELDPIAAELGGAPARAPQVMP